MSTVEVRLARALEEALHAAGDDKPISHAGRLARGILRDTLARYDLALADLRPPIPEPRSLR